MTSRVPDPARFPPKSGASSVNWAAHPLDERPFFCRPAGDIGKTMWYFIAKVALTGLLAAAIAEIARRYPGWGGLVASLPLTSLMAMIWLWRDTGDAAQVGALAASIFWFILPSLPLFLVIPALIRAGLDFWPTMGISIALTLALYAAMFWAAPKLGIAL